MMNHIIVVHDEHRQCRMVTSQSTWCWFIWFYFSVYLCATYVVAVYPYVYCVLGSSKSEIKPSSLLGQLAVPPMFEVFEGYMYTRRCNAKGSKKALCTGQDISHSGKKNVQVRKISTGSQNSCACGW